MPPKLPIYLDHHATTPVDPRVFEAMAPFFTEHFGNASSKTHAFGWRAEAAVEAAREQVARSIGAADPKEILWTSGTTESNNQALFGILGGIAGGKDRHLITCVTEHVSVLDAARALEREGARVTYLPVDSQGLIDPEEVRKSIEADTILISVMAANNEIGTIQPVGEIGRIAKKAGILFHVDAAQACGKIPVDVEAMGIDLLSASAHKVYGPKGVGILYVRSRSPHVAVAPLLYGGGQERGLRPGTLAVPNIVGMGKAFEIADAEREAEAERLLKLRRRLQEGLMTGLLNGPAENRLPGNLNLSFPGIRSDALIPRVRDVALSSGSACASSEGSRPSYVIQALGGDPERALSSIRFGIGRFNTEEEIDFVVERVIAALKELRLPSSTTGSSS